MEQESSIQAENIETGLSTKVEPINAVQVPQNGSNAGVNPAIRQNLVNLAVQFLQNPKVEKTTIEQRRKFLSSKGLTELELNEAFRQSGIQQPQNFVSTVGLPVPPPYYQQQPGMSQQLMIPQSSFLTRLKDGLTTAALISALLYGAYMFFKRYIYPFLFKKKPKKSIESEIQDLSKLLKENTDEIKSTIVELQTELSSSEPTKRSFNNQIDNLKSELHTIKSLLLSKNQFPLMGSTVPPSIPAWQLASAASNPDEGPSDDRDKSPGAADDIEVASGGSSETEVLNKNNSDSSSIEIM